MNGFGERKRDINGLNERTLHASRSEGLEEWKLDTGARVGPQFFWRFSVDMVSFGELHWIPLCTVSNCGRPTIHLDVSLTVCFLPWAGICWLSRARTKDVSMYNWLVVWNMFYFPIYWVSNHPNWRTHIFQRGGPTTNQIKMWCSGCDVGTGAMTWEHGSQNLSTKTG